jgi:transposase
MDNTKTVEQHYQRLMLLGAPWKVDAVEEALEQERVRITIGHEKGALFPCPICKKLSPVYDHSPLRSWRHLSVMQFRLEVHCATPRCNCQEHGIKNVTPPWADPKSRFTFLFEHSAVETLLSCGTISQAAKLLNVHWESLQRIIDRAVERGLLRRNAENITKVGIDEKSFLKGQQYVSLMCDLDDNRVLEVVRGHDTQSVVNLWNALGSELAKKVEAVAMDMGQSMISGTQKCAPQAAIVHDKFHVSKLLNEAVDKTRKEENRRLLSRNDKTLCGTRYSWLYGDIPEDLDADFTELLAVNLKTSRAWMYKEQMRDFWKQQDVDRGNLFFKHWYNCAMHSKLPSVKKAAKTLKSHLSGLISYFTHPISNALCEGFNSKIQAIKSFARGFRNFENYRSRILFFCGKLDMSPFVRKPSTHEIP